MTKPNRSHDGMWPRPSHLAIVSLDVESSDGGVVFLHDLHAWHEASNSHVVRHRLHTTHTHTHTHTHTTHTHTSHMHTHTCTRIRTHTHAYAHAHTHARTHTQHTHTTHTHRKQYMKYSENLSTWTLKDTFSGPNFICVMR